MIRKIRVKGAVQGVGYRPFIAEKATEYNLKGQVKNIGAAVDILLIGAKEDVYAFTQSLKTEYPAGAFIIGVSVLEEAEENDNFAEEFTSFKIAESGEIDLSSELPVFLPDIGICDDCMDELLDKNDRRYNYPLISCAGCGPRISILNKLPYDRNTTTMEDFEMCPSCKKEYLFGRRRHAQTISCHDCGPQMILKALNQNETIKDSQKEADPVLTSIEILNKGGIIALKGISGYQLVCLPNDESAKRLRQIKGRENKPFAVMFSDIKAIEEYCYVNDEEKKLLSSMARPIVLLNKKKDFPYEVCRESAYIGAFLPSSGVHRLILDKTGPLIVTSANRSDEPMIFEDEKIFEKFLNPSQTDDNLNVDAVLYHKRRIKIAQDDSVTFVIRTSKGYSMQFVRRARGYFPLPIFLDKDYGERNVLAMGADLKNTFAFARKDRVILTQHLGDLKDLDVLLEYKELLPYYKKLFSFEEEKIVCDMHPGYFSVRKAKNLAERSGKSITYLQHHEAHAYSVMAEEGLESCIAISFDGTGYGKDEKIWGGEYFYIDKTSCSRMGHMSYVKLCGGDQASKKADMVRDCYKLAGDVCSDVPDIIKAAVSQNINTFETSSVGRLFDGVSSLLGICDYNSYEGECASRLEKKAWEYTGVDMPELLLPVCEDEEGCIITDQIYFFKNILETVNEGKYKTEITAFAFHAAIITAIKKVCDIISAKTGEKKVCLSGGVFQNRLLLTKTVNLLSISGYKVYWNKKVPANDAGIALGQAYFGLLD